MELPSIGGRCAAYGCGSFDFLPIECLSCHKSFCRHHIILDSHACPSLHTKRNAEALENSSYEHEAQRCALDSCDKLTLESVIVDTTEPDHRVVAVCPHCSRAFCATHRHASDHACTNIPSVIHPSQKNPAAHELLQKHFPTKDPTSTPQAPSKISKHPPDPKKLARLRAVELMKMRHHALPADPRDKNTSVPPTQRLHLKVATTNTTSPPVENIFWLRKTVGVGRAIDMLAAQFSIQISDKNAVYLDKLPSDDGTPIRLRNDQLLSDQVEDGETLYLSVEPRG